MAAKITKLARQTADPAIALPDDTAADDPAFLHAVLCQVGLPRSPAEPEVRSFIRSSGTASLRIDAGEWFDGRGWSKLPLPSGTRPRLVLFHVCSEAVRSKSPVVEVEHSTSAFLKRLGIAKGGESMAHFKRQMLALAACRMQLGYQTASRVINLKCDPIEQFEAWLQHDDSGQRVMWPGVMTLSGKFFETLSEHAVPLDPHAIAGLQNSALALDTYTWLAHRLCRVRKDAGIVLPWRALKGQFGQEYRTEKDFKRELAGALKKALAVYPAARVEKVRGGLRLFPSAPPIKRLGVVVQMPAEPKAVAAITANSAVAALPKPAHIPAAPLISEDALARVREVAPGWDKYYLAARYTEWMKDKAHPQKPDAAFLGWCKKFTKGKPA